MRRGRHRRPARLPDPIIAFCCTCLMWLAWDQFAHDNAWTWTPLMVMLSLPYLMLWAWPFLRGTSNP